jgi:hypothetical protein
MQSKICGGVLFFSIPHVVMFSVRSFPNINVTMSEIHPQQNHPGQLQVCLARCGHDPEEEDSHATAQIGHLKGLCHPVLAVSN